MPPSAPVRSTIARSMLPTTSWRAKESRPDAPAERRRGVKRVDGFFVIIDRFDEFRLDDVGEEEGDEKEQAAIQRGDQEVEEEALDPRCRPRADIQRRARGEGKPGAQRESPRRGIGLSAKEERQGGEGQSGSESGEPQLSRGQGEVEADRPRTRGGRKPRRTGGGGSRNTSPA